MSRRAQILSRRKRERERLGMHAERKKERKKNPEQLPDRNQLVSDIFSRL